MEISKQLVKFDTVKIINFSLILFLVPLVLGLALNIFVFDAPKPATGVYYLDAVIIVFVCVALIFMHEGLHALGFMLFGKAKPKDIKFGLAPKQGMLYCACSKPMTASSYMGALILPVLVTGIIPFVIVTVLGNFMWVILFSVMISGGAGDFVMFDSVRKLKPSQLIMDHPKAPAYYLIYEKGREPKDFTEVTQEQEREIEEQMKVSPFSGKNAKKSWAMKLFKVLLFLSLSVIALAIIGILLIS
ncbi:MAG: DUF3267 domain-containing protein [Christensenellales bacterium]|jgi:hypothetical protein|nr:DUF3267 domain-containing protein [Clostridiales bacterium]